MREADATLTTDSRIMVLMSMFGRRSGIIRAARHRPKAAHFAARAGGIAGGWPGGTTRISRSPVAAPAGLRQHFPMSTPTAAGPTIWPTRAATADRAWRCSEWWERELHACYRGPDPPPGVRRPGATRSGSSGSRPSPGRFAGGLPPGPGGAALRGHSASCWTIAAIRPTRWDNWCLYLGRCHTPERATLSDSICTGLQLANFWQDVASDWDRGRIYLPQGRLPALRLRRSDVRPPRVQRAFRRLLAAEVDQAEGCCGAGCRWSADALVVAARRGAVHPRRAGHSAGDPAAGLRRLGFAAGGRQEGKAPHAGDLLVESQAGPRPGRHFSMGFSPCHNGSNRKAEDISMSFCGRVRSQPPRVPADRAAGAVKFPVAFLLLPRAKRRAMEALYAFMRHSDDLADDPEPGQPADAPAGSRARSALAHALQTPCEGPATTAGRAILPAVVATVRS